MCKPGFRRVVMATALSVLAPLELAGVENIGGTGPATRFSFTTASNIVPDRVDGQPVFMNSGSIWVDNDQPPVIVKHRIEGSMGEGGAARPFFIEVTNSDFRQVPNCSLHEPYRRTMRMGGLLDDKQMAQMEEAKQRLAEFEQQMAAMPQAQRAMMESMMGSQMGTLRNMAGDGVLSSTRETTEIICTPDLPAMFGSRGSALDLIPTVDLAEIQRNPATLGYEPGNTDGVLDTLTEIAISQYQAERGMAVTGQPDAQLAVALAAEVANR